MKPAPHSSGSGSRRFSTGRSLAASLLALTSAALAVGCLERPVEPIQPNTSNVFVDYIPNSKIDKIDLLFVVDNSVSMADKQAILKKAVPQMVTRLVSPNCVNPDTGASVGNVTGTCDAAAGFVEEFQPINDIHIGVISSSLGGHGAQTYGSGCTDLPPENDRSMLMPIVRPELALPASDPKGFLTWAPAETLSDADRLAAANQLSSDFALHVEASGQIGCGFEATLESWYRFLVDPAPPKAMSVSVVDGRATPAVSTGVDDLVLAQRAAFLRDDSLVAIIILSDENDCSAMDGGNYYENAGFGWLVADTGGGAEGDTSLFPGFQAASTACSTNPNDKCCYSCTMPPNPLPEGCSADPVCDGSRLAPEFDRPNSRCFDTQRRFGMDLLYPTSRYVSGLRDQRVINSQDGTSVDNPLLVNPATGLPRPPGLVFYAAIVGVPWQDIATTESLTGPGLEFLTAEQLGQPRNDVEGKPSTWDIILGQPNLHPSDPACKGSKPDARCGSAPTLPLDGLMVESIEPRQGANPVTGDALVQPGTTGANPINGHEYNNAVPNAPPDDNTNANNDLQYACIFRLETPNPDCVADDLDCDCGYQTDKNLPLCKDAPDGAAAGTTTQYWAKAYPGLRFLEVARDFGANSILGSICPKVLDEGSSDFGYNPAVNAIVDRLAETLKGQCLPRSLTLDEATGKAPCEMVEALGPAARTEQGINDCVDGRQPVKAELVAPVIQQLEEARLCTGADCNSWLLCALPQHVRNTDAGNLCFSNEPPENQSPGYCYIDPAKGPDAGGQGCSEDPEDWATTCTNPNTESCGATEKRILRFVGEGTPRTDSATVVACTADAAQGSPVLPPITAPPAGTGGGTP